MAFVTAITAAFGQVRMSDAAVSIVQRDAVWDRPLLKPVAWRSGCLPHADQALLVPP